LKIRQEKVGIFPDFLRVAAKWRACGPERKIKKAGPGIHRIPGLWYRRVRR